MLVQRLLQQEQPGFARQRRVEAVAAIGLHMQLHRFAQAAQRRRVVGDAADGDAFVAATGVEHDGSAQQFDVHQR